jgi:DNA-binding response OmpR family regulator
MERLTSGGFDQTIWDNVHFGRLMLILVVEDEALIAFAVEWALKIAGHDVLGPTDQVEEAIELSQHSRPDLALIDLNLRDGGDGADVARYLHARYRTPCLFLSAQTAQARVHREVAWGLVRKPYDTAAVPHVVRFVADTLQGRQAGPVPPGLELFRSDGK